MKLTLVILAISLAVANCSSELDQELIRGNDDDSTTRTANRDRTLGEVLTRTRRQLHWDRVPAIFEKFKNDKEYTELLNYMKSNGTKMWNEVQNKTVFKKFTDYLQKNGDNVFAVKDMVNKWLKKNQIQPESNNNITDQTVINWITAVLNPNGTVTQTGVKPDNKSVLWSDYLNDPKVMNISNVHSLYRLPKTCHECKINSLLNYTNCLQRCDFKNANFECFDACSFRVLDTCLMHCQKNFTRFEIDWTSPKMERTCPDGKERSNITDMCEPLCKNKSEIINFDTGKCEPKTNNYLKAECETQGTDFIFDQIKKSCRLISRIPLRECKILGLFIHDRKCVDKKTKIVSCLERKQFLNVTTGFCENGVTNVAQQQCIALGYIWNGTKCRSRAVMTERCEAKGEYYDEDSMTCTRIADIAYELCNGPKYVWDKPRAMCITVSQRLESCLRENKAMDEKTKECRNGLPGTFEKQCVETAGFVLYEDKKTCGPLKDVKRSDCERSLEPHDKYVWIMNNQGSRCYKGTDLMKVCLARNQGYNFTTGACIVDEKLSRQNCYLLNGYVWKNYECKSEEKALKECHAVDKFLVKEDEENEEEYNAPVATCQELDFISFEECQDPQLITWGSNCTLKADAKKKCTKKGLALSQRGNCVVDDELAQEQCEEGNEHIWKEEKYCAELNTISKNDCNDSRLFWKDGRCRNLENLIKECLDKDQAWDSEKADCVNAVKDHVQQQCAELEDYLWIDGNCHEIRATKENQCLRNGLVWNDGRCASISAPKSTRQKKDSFGKSNVSNILDVDEETETSRCFCPCNDSRIPSTTNMGLKRLLNEANDLIRRRLLKVEYKRNMWNRKFQNYIEFMNTAEMTNIFNELWEGPWMKAFEDFLKQRDVSRMNFADFFNGHYGLMK